MTSPTTRWFLQSVIVKRRYVDDLKKAALLARMYTSSWRRMVVKEGTYRFEVLPSFLFKDWKSRKVGEIVTLVYGARVKKNKQQEV